MKRLIILIGIFVSELVFGMSVRAEDPISPVSVVTMQAVPKVIIKERLWQNATNWNEIGSQEDDAYFLEEGEWFYPGSRFIDSDRCFVVNSQGEIYIFDIVNNRIKKYDKEGKYLKSIPVKSWIGKVHIQPANETMPSYRFVDPLEYVGRNIAIDEEDNIYIYSWKDMQEQKDYLPSVGVIWKYSPEDKLIRTWETNVMDEFKIDKSYLDKKVYYYAVKRCKIRLESTTNGTNKYIITDPDGTEKTLLSTIRFRMFCSITKDGYYHLKSNLKSGRIVHFYYDKALILRKVVIGNGYGERENDGNLYLLKVNQDNTILKVTRWQLEVMNGKQK